MFFSLFILTALMLMLLTSKAFVRTLPQRHSTSSSLLQLKPTHFLSSRQLIAAISMTKKRVPYKAATVNNANEEGAPPVSKESSRPSSSIFTKSSLVVNTSDRPFTLPPGEFRPKQSLGQNYLSDQNYVMKIVNAFSTDEVDSDRVVEIGPGLGALTRMLVRKYPTMTAIELDQRAVAFLNEKLPGVNVIHKDVLKFDWPQWAAIKNGRLSIIANLPYYVTSQVLFSLADAHQAIDKAVVTMQLEVAERITAAPGTKQYGIPSVVFQLYGKTHMNFKIPPKVFFPVPKVDSALVTIDFTSPHKDLHRVDANQLRKVVTYAFRQRRKMLRQSLKALVNQDQLSLSNRWATLRPEQLKPEEFLYLTIQLYGENNSTNQCDEDSDDVESLQENDDTDGGSQSRTSLLRRTRQRKKQETSVQWTEPHPDRNKYVSKSVWRKALKAKEFKG